MRDRHALHAPPSIEDIPQGHDANRLLRRVTVVWCTGVALWAALLLSYGVWMRDGQSIVLIILCVAGVAWLGPQWRLARFTGQWNRAYRKLVRNGEAARGRIVELSIVPRGAHSLVSGVV